MPKSRLGKSSLWAETNQKFNNLILVSMGKKSIWFKGNNGNYLIDDHTRKVPFQLAKLCRGLENYSKVHKIIQNCII